MEMQKSVKDLNYTMFRLKPDKQKKKIIADYNLNYTMFRLKLCYPTTKKQYLLDLNYTMFRLKLWKNC